ncbi:TRM11 family methyltransferase [Paenibacillus sp. YYML68]|uniref:TRM11 family SAM-dependent methyltransferase n=1 Tax=Paenibacillus sp. YYML68 TaxID=2909250 RepID=UPI0024923CC9|nr:RNA methyltransferase [Paenibacillus sp. YYML68]
MESQSDLIPTYVYTFACHEDEAQLCALEQRALFGTAASEEPLRWLVSARRVDASRSPFVKQRVEVSLTAASPEALAEEASRLELAGCTFKIVFVPTDDPYTFDERRQLERLVGSRVRGKADMRTPDRTLGLVRLGARWALGEAADNKALWLRHKDKPQPYSTALGTRTARALVNIAVPEPEGTRVVDPCCGIGTVLIEAMSMGIEIAGMDVNPLAVRGARVNLVHFGYTSPKLVQLQDMRTAAGHYDTAIVDMPYNLCSKLPEAEQLELVQGARRLASRAVFVSMEPLEHVLQQADFTTIDRCLIRKGSFVRHVAVCV